MKKTVGENLKMFRIKKGLSTPKGWMLISLLYVREVLHLIFVGTRFGSSKR
mgnify:CR=1 FL=1